MFIEIAAFITIYVVIYGGIYIYEKKIWNDGFCKKNGEKWDYFDSSSGGQKGFKAGDEIFWFNYDFRS